MCFSFKLDVCCSFSWVVETVTKAKLDKVRGFTTVKGHTGLKCKGNSFGVVLLKGISKGLSYWQTLVYSFLASYPFS